MMNQLALSIQQKNVLPITVEQFENETCISLVVMVDMATEQLWRFFELAPNAAEITSWHDDATPLDAVAEKICTVYANNLRFRKKCLAADPREFIRVFVQHWVSSLFCKRFPELRCRIPNDYFVGAPLPEFSVAHFTN